MERLRHQHVPIGMNFWSLKVYFGCHWQPPKGFTNQHIPKLVWRAMSLVRSSIEDRSHGTGHFFIEMACHIILVVYFMLEGLRLITYVWI